MFQTIFQQFGLSKNESAIYEILLREGETSVATIAKKSNIHRRNVYDALRRLIEKGVVFEVLSARENLYQAVNPDKFMEFVEEKRTILERAMPHLQSLYTSTPRKQEVYIYRGPEGWKNYMRDIIRLGEDFYCIGAKGAWLDKRVQNFFPHFAKEMERKKIGCHHLFDYEVKEQCPEILPYVGERYKFFPPEFSAPASIDVFGDHVNILSDIHIGTMGEEFNFTVIVNQQIADAFRIWFEFMYSVCPGVE